MEYLREKIIIENKPKSVCKARVYRFNDLSSSSSNQIEQGRQGYDEAIQNSSKQEVKQQPVVAEKRIGRNDTCPCGSGKKFKHCHGKLS